LDTGTFSGTVAIDVDVMAACNEVVLHAADLEVASAVAVIDGVRHDLTVTLDEATEQLSLHGPNLGAGPARLELAFTGVLNDRLRGFYRSTLVLDGEERTIATTQFQSTDARRAFPCFDEPDLKATFAVTLVVASDLLAVSNGAEESRTPLGNGTDRVVFIDTIPLSTYLVAFVVGPLEATQPVDVDGVPVRVIHPPGKGDQTAFALEVAAHSLRWLADWYDIAVPGGKVDLVALPDFAFGAMENLGCITFREVLLLVDPSTADQRELESVAAVLSHELAHLWFGDLVTMRWWNGIWLNEAFATFMEMKAVETFRPDWQVWAGFTAARSAAMDVDALAATRPIEYPVVTPADAESMFDLLTYEKGAAVVRMLEQFLGEDVF
ncbi:MAG TPA: M1 family metallopeptidase, partial [Acidimicrobiales bacterium]|nr:M1 family metallopeptidase [Acidimicrobiales bacterium]